MSAGDRGGLKAAFSNFSRVEDQEAELKLLGRTIGAPTSEVATPMPVDSYPVATTQPPAIGSLIPKPLFQREPVRQLSFRCPIPIAAELRRKAAFNQLEQQEIIIEGIKRILAELPDPPANWES